MGNRIIENRNDSTNVGSELPTLMKLICPAEQEPARVSYKNMLKGKLSSHRPTLLMCNILGKMKAMGSNRQFPKIK